MEDLCIELNLTKNFQKFCFLEKIYIGERIRDIKFLKKNNSLILALKKVVLLEFLKS